MTAAPPDRISQVLDVVHSLDGALILSPTQAPFPEIAWGDHFCYHAPDGQVPTTEQPYATIVTKDYPDEPASDLGPSPTGELRWRLNLHLGSTEAAVLLGPEPEGGWDVTAADTFFPHPVYGRLGWVSVVSPDAVLDHSLELVRLAHARAVARHQRRDDTR